jgi:hypothetical protein
VVILTDGDVVFQPRKVERSGLWAAVGGEVLIFIHKEQMLDEVERRYPARRYVMIDDKLRILTAIKDVWRDRVTTGLRSPGPLRPRSVTSRPVSACGPHGRGDRGRPRSEDLRM